MASFYDYEVKQFSLSELDSIALSGGVVTRIAEGYARRADQKDQHDWSFRWINTRGEGNRGTLVLRPLSARSRAVAREGFVAMVQRLAGIERQEALKYVSASSGVQYAREAGVIRAVFALKSSPAWEFFNLSSVRRWAEEWKLDELRDLSVLRMMSVRAVVEGMNSSSH